MAKSLSRILMQVNHALVVIFSVANTSFNAIPEKKKLRENFRIYTTLTRLLMHESSSGHLFLPYEQ